MRCRPGHEVLGDGRAFGVRGPELAEPEPAGADEVLQAEPLTGELLADRPAEEGVPVEDRRPKWRPSRAGRVARVVANRHLFAHLA